MNNNNWRLDELMDIVLSAGRKVLEVYGSNDFVIRQKSDETPVTYADKLSEEIIVKGLNRLFPDIPVISEESRQHPFRVRKVWDYFWLLDPLDGTREFIKKNGEFTINLSLINKNRPFLGIILAPAQDMLYFSQRNKGCFRRVADEDPQPILVNKKGRSKPVLIRSRSHSSADEESMISSLGELEQIHMGSSLKFCYIAEGKADLYIRMGNTMEWDTAAGQCIVENAGGKVLNLQGEPLAYNKEILKNNSFVCFSGHDGASSIAKRLCSGKAGVGLPAEGGIVKSKSGK